MKRIESYLIAALGSLILVLVWSQPAGAQQPYNRKIKQIAVIPDEGTAGVHDIHAIWAFTVEPTSMTLNLSTEVVLQINGTTTSSTLADIYIEAGSGIGCDDIAPCIDTCGSAIVGGGTVTLSCHKDSPCTETFCNCDCGFWISTEFEDVPLLAGDEIRVFLIPTPGSLPDGDPSDDSILATFHDRPIGWNRVIENVVLEEVGTDLYDVHVAGSVGWEARAGFMNLDLTLELRVNGVLLDIQNVPAEVDGIFDQACWEAGCGSACGDVNGVTRYCDPFLWWDCGCVGGWITLFPDLSSSPGDVIEVTLMPTPGALPELPGTNDDDQFILTCCSTASVSDGREGSPAGQLGQNHPNPFRPLPAITFEIAATGPAQIDIFDAGGRHVRSLFNRTLTAGPWSVTWDGQNDAAESAAAGAYFYRLTTDQGTETRRMALLR